MGWCWHECLSMQHLDSTEGCEGGEMKRCLKVVCGNLLKNGSTKHDCEKNYALGRMGSEC